jgi:hypothetical protein
LDARGNSNGPFGSVRTGRYRALWWLAVPYAAILTYSLVRASRNHFRGVDQFAVFWGVTAALVIVGLLFLRLGRKTSSQRRALAGLRPGASVILCSPSEAMENGLRAGGYLGGKIPPAMFATIDASSLELWPRLAEKVDVPFARIPLADIAGVRADSVRVDASRYSGGAHSYDWRAIVVVLNSGGTIPLALYKPSGFGLASAAQANALIAEFTPRVPLLA